MPANLLISLAHGGTAHIARTFQNSIFAILLLDVQHGLLELFFLIQLLCIDGQLQANGDQMACVPHVHHDSGSGRLHDLFCHHAHAGHTER